MILSNNISIQGNIILFINIFEINVSFSTHQLFNKLDSILVSIADRNAGGEHLKNGSWTGGLGLIHRNVRQKIKSFSIKNKTYTFFKVSRYNACPFRIQ
jgi:hypothetical protein